ncbi:MAG TPA: hypothetical protein VMK31_09090 [Sphingomicrobium sp.]|nr:hypothetical protein [Sphingomicrobium sp.]
MSSTIRRCVLAAGAAALISAQAAYAVPTQSRTSTVDPLVALSLLSSQSNLVVQGGTATAATTAATAAAMQTDRDRKSAGALLVLLGAIVFIGLAVALISGGGKGSGNLTPISPQ